MDTKTFLLMKNFYVITGGPGVGKTSLINELEKLNFSVIPESAREIIKNETAHGGQGLPWKDKALYAMLMLEAEIESYNALSGCDSEIYFFDRGIIDTVCYAGMAGIGVSEEMDSLAKKLRYNRKVFILPPWKEIYHTDSERKQSWEEALLTFAKMMEAYAEYGYELIEVRMGTVENRARFII